MQPTMNVMMKRVCEGESGEKWKKKEMRQDSKEEMRNSCETIF